MRVCKIFRFDAAHYLPGYAGKCGVMHGHSWVLEVELEGKAGKEGMVVDFARLKEHIDKEVMHFLDHTLLNTYVKAPTCENLLLWIAARLGGVSASDTAWNEREMTMHPVFIENVPVVRLKLSETVDSFATLLLPTHE